MFDIAWSELLIIIVVALVVVGPKDLPRLMRTAGQWAGRARAMADQFRRSFDDIARQSELDELRSEMTRLQQSAIPNPAEIETAMYPTGNPPINLGGSAMDDVSPLPAPEPQPSIEPPPSSSAVPQALPETPEAPART
jgi:sec-independent protein translocase protein TatB